MPVPWYYYNDADAHALGLHELIDGSHSEKYSDTEYTTSLSFVCPWKKRFACQTYLLSHTAPSTPTDGYTGEIDGVTYTSTYLSVYYPTVCTDVSVSVFSEPGTGLDPNTGKPVQTYLDFTVAKLTANYKALAKPAAWSYSINYSPQVEARQLPTWGFYWASDKSPLADDQSPMVQEHSIVIDHTINSATRVPDWLFSLNGQINANPVTDGFLGKTFAAYTLLFSLKSLSHKLTRVRGEDSRLWDIQFSYTHNPYGWNTVRRPSSMIITGGNMYHDRIITESGTELVMYDEAPFPPFNPEDFIKE